MDIWFPVTFLSRENFLSRKGKILIKPVCSMWREREACVMNGWASSFMKLFQMTARLLRARGILVISSPKPESVV